MTVLTECVSLFPHIHIHTAKMGIEMIADPNTELTVTGKHPLWHS